MVRKEMRLKISQFIWSIEKNVKFLGIRDDISQLLNACDLFVSSSAWEGFGIAILEAMLCQRPIVATATDGAKELLNRNLVPIQQPNTFANEILQALKNSENSIKYENINRFDWSVIVDKWLSLYKCKNIY